MTCDRTILVLSDLHLGKGPCTVRALEPLLHGAREVVVNGDVAELHLPGAVDRAREELERLRDACCRAGASLRCIEGNHDLGVSGVRHALLADGRVLVTHGDAFDPCVAPWSPWAADARAAVASVLAQYPESERDSADAVFEAARAAAACEWADADRARRHASAWALLLRPHAILLILKYWRRYPHLAGAFAARCAPGAQVVVCGHSHRPGVWRIDGRIILNTGHFEFPARPYAVLIDDEGAGEPARVAWQRIRRRRGLYELAPEATASFMLRPAAATAAPSTPLAMPQPSRSATSSSVATLPRAPGA
ncbi:MAG: metallophosphoesterase family protein [Phycisphaeraceae bacterium]|nr:metallophosphoesterase family protein [Phycisphaeraceae bacterium]